MSSKQTTGGKTTSQTETPTETKPFSFSRLFNRNGHEKKVAPPSAKAAGPPKTIFREYFESAVVTVIMALFGMTFIVQAVKVPTGSMQNTILIGDHLLVNKFIFAPGTSAPFLPQSEIQRGNIIVFKYPGNPFNPEGDERPENRPILTNYVKRVIGLPGDRIRLEGKRVVVNGEVIPEHLVEAIDHNQKDPLEIVNEPERKPGELYDVYYQPDPEYRRSDYTAFRGGEELVVPAGSYFVMGDNRDNSEDSRFWGFVPRDLVIGRAMFVYWSYDESAPATNYGFPIDFLVNTRWSRTGTFVK